MAYAHKKLFGAGYIAIAVLYSYIGRSERGFKYLNRDTTEKEPEK